MRFDEPLIEGRLVERYKRFLADVDLSTGERVTAHCANPGAMLGLGRALGETIAVMIILSASYGGSAFNPSLFAGGETFASKIAVRPLR